MHKMRTIATDVTWFVCVAFCPSICWTHCLAMQNGRTGRGAILRCMCCGRFCDPVHLEIAAGHFRDPETAQQSRDCAATVIGGQSRVRMLMFTCRHLIKSVQHVNRSNHKQPALLLNQLLLIDTWKECILISVLWNIVMTLTTNISGT